MKIILYFLYFCFILNAIYNFYIAFKYEVKIKDLSLDNFNSSEGYGVIGLVKFILSVLSIFIFYYFYGI